jgi:hypothetical protein
VLIFVVGRTRLDRYEEFRLHFEDWREIGSSSTVVKGSVRSLMTRLLE